VLEIDSVPADGPPPRPWLSVLASCLWRGARKRARRMWGGASTARCNTSPVSTVLGRGAVMRVADVVAPSSPRQRDRLILYACTAALCRVGGAPSYRRREFSSTGAGQGRCWGLQAKPAGAATRYLRSTEQNQTGAGVRVPAGKWIFAGATLGSRFATL